MPTSSVILKSYQSTFSSDEKNSLRYEERIQDLLKSNKRDDLLIPLNYYLELLEKTNKITFLYMSAAKKEETLRNLRITYFLLLAQTKTEKNYGKSENLKSYQDNVTQCETLIDALLYNKVWEEEDISPEPNLLCDGNPASYLALFLGQWVGQQMVAWTDRKTKTIKDAMGWFNEKRLYWVWGSGLLKTILELMPQDFFNSDQAKQTVRLPDPYTGFLSWGLYYFRFSLNLTLLLRHTIKGPWMSEEEQLTPWTERFLTQWDQRKFTLLNDSVWATGNIVCFFILNGNGVLGTWGDALTLALLLFDVSLSIWDFAEQKSIHKKEILDYENTIKALETTIKAAENSDNTDKDYHKKIRELNLQLAGIQHAQKQCEKDWDFKKLGLINNTAYAVGLMIAFILLTMPFLPISGGAMVVIGAAGAVLCFALSVIYNAVKGGMEVYKAHGSAKAAKLEYSQKIELFKELLTENPLLDDNEKKFLFLEIKGLKAETEYQQAMVLLQTMHLVRSIIFETVVPAIIFTSLVFFPLGMGFAMIGGVLALALATNIIINQWFTPKKGEAAEFNDAEYKAFCANPDILDKVHSKNTQTFFSPAVETPGTENKPSQEQDAPEDDMTGTYLMP